MLRTSQLVRRHCRSPTGALSATKWLTAFSCQLCLFVAISETLREAEHRPVLSLPCGKPCFQPTSICKTSPCLCLIYLFAAFKIKPEDMDLKHVTHGLQAEASKYLAPEHTNVPNRNYRLKRAFLRTALIFHILATNAVKTCSQS